MESDPKNKEAESIPASGGGGAAGTERSAGEAAAEHYYRGNRLFEFKEWSRAAAEWRSADSIWNPQAASPARARRRLAQLRAALLLVFTFLMIHLLLYYLFPREPFEMAQLASSQGSSQSWWERFMDSGRPQPGDAHKMSFREWWMRVRQRMRDGDGEETARRDALRPSIDERWAELLQRYGRWGESYNWDMDYAVVAGHGLSKLGEYDEAVRVLEEAVRKAGKPAKLADLYQGLANAHYYKGYHLGPDGLATYELGQVSKAMRSYRESIRYERRPLSHGNLGWMYFLLGDYERAEEQGLEALAINGGLHYVRLNLGLVYLMQEKLRESFQAYLTVLRNNPGDEVYLGGINDLKEVLRDNPGRYPFAYLMVGMLAVKKGDMTEAKEALTRYLAGPPQGIGWAALARELLDNMKAGSPGG